MFYGDFTMSRLLLSAFIVCCSCQLSWTHVALKYPPARKYDLDFLDNLRTPGPCGMPQGEERTTIVAGSTFNVTWHLAYPHRGGYKLQLLTDEGRAWMDLTSSTSPNGFIATDSTAQVHQIYIPRNISCKGCSIRLEREALEWANNYLFWSCADVNIVHEDEYKEDCFGNGQFRNGVCICTRLHSGPRCQYKDECWEDKDCGKNGKCINIKATTFPQKQCYCQLGWYGENCSKESPYKTTEIDLSKHQKYDLSNDFKLYWKVLQLQEEIEIVAKVKSTTYVGLGWRPLGLTQNCKAFPPLEDHVVFETAFEGVGVAEPEPIPEPESPPQLLSTKVVSEPLHKEDRSRTLPETNSSETSFTAHKGNVTEVDLSADDVAVLEEAAAKPTTGNSPINETVAVEGRTFGVINNEGSPEPKTTDEPIIKEQYTEATAESNRHPVTLEVSAQPMNVMVEKESETNQHSFVEEPPGEVNYGVEHHTDDGMVEYVHGVDTTTAANHFHSVAKRDTLLAQTKIANISHAIPEPAAEPVASTQSPSNRNPKSELEASDIKTFKAGPYTPKIDFHAMDCTDMVIGMAYGNYSRVFDYYTRDRSTPRVDSFWGGTDSLTAATGYEKDGFTTIIFRRKLKSKEVTDHSFVKEPMHVIWAKGQEPGSFVHHPPSGIEKGTPGVPDFYRRDELKYHGHGSQRGNATIDFLNHQAMVIEKHVEESKGEWKIPSSCSIDDCEYRATWEYMPSQDSILFTVATNKTDKWTGIGFSEDSKMPNTDAILGWVDEIGRTFVMDVWIDQYGPPILDKSQDVDGIKGWKKGGRVSLSFIRKRSTGDSTQDLAFTDSSCLYMIYPHDGGVFNAVSKKIRKHDSTPIVSKSKICIRGSGTGDSAGNDLNVVQTLAEVLPTISSTQATSQVSPTVDSKPSSAFIVSIRLPNQTLDDAIERGIDFKMLIREGLNDYISNALRNAEGFKKAEVTALESEKNEAHVVAKMRVYIEAPMASKDSHSNFIESTVNYLNKTLSSTISNGKVGRLIVDPAYLVIDPPQEAIDNQFNVTIGDIRTLGEKSVNEETLLYVIIAAVSALGLLLVIQIICMICRCHAAKKAKVSKERLIVGGAGWKDYTAGASPGNGSTYDYEHNYNGHKEETPKMGKYPLSSTNGTSRSGTHSNNHGNNGQSKSGVAVNGNNETRSLNRNPRGGLSLEPDRNHYSRRSESLPRPNVIGDSHTYDTRERIARPSSASSMYPQGGLQPDFYFMPSQRRYSGEVVRVYVDYNNPNYTGK